MTKPTEYTLDVSKWRCGKDGEYALGEGDTLLLNKEGYMCCLGQFALQAGVTEDRLMYRGAPVDMNTLYDKNFTKVLATGHIINTDLADDLIQINDDANTTPKRKIDLLVKRMDSDGIKLNIVGDLPNDQTN